MHQGGGASVCVGLKTDNYFSDSTLIFMPKFPYRWKGGLREPTPRGGVEARHLLLCLWSLAVFGKHKTELVEGLCARVNQLDILEDMHEEQKQQVGELFTFPSNFVILFIICHLMVSLLIPTELRPMLMLSVVCFRQHNAYWALLPVAQHRSCMTYQVTTLQK